MEREDEDLAALLTADDATAAGFLRLLVHPADVVEALRTVERDRWAALLQLIDDEEERAEVVTLLDEDERDDLVDGLTPEQLTELLVEMDSDDAADLVGELEADERSDALAGLPAAERAQVEALLAYPEDSAGGIMQLEVARIDASATVGAAIARVREMNDDGYDVLRVYVTTQDGKVTGSINLIDLLLHDDAAPVSKVVEPLVASVTPLVDQEEVAELFRKYDLVVLPVVDDDSKLLGRIVFDDIVDVLTEEHEEDALRQAGTDVEELLYRDRALPIAKVRLPWISVNLFGSLISATLIHAYEPVLQKAILIASFVPVITAMGGNVGTQSAIILTRGFATGRLDDSDVPRTLFKELRVGLIMGALCGMLVGAIAALGFGGGSVYLGFVVGTSMLAAMTLAAVVGTSAPAMLKRVGADPAIASGPLVTTLNDIVGIVIYMSFAILFLEQIRAV